MFIVTSLCVCHPHWTLLLCYCTATVLLLLAPKSCNFTSRSSVRPRQSMGRVARGADMLEKMCNFTSRSCVRPRQSMGRVERVAPTCWKKCATLPCVPAFDHANPWEGLRVTPKMCNFTSRSSVRPRQSMGRVARHVENVQLYLAFKRSTMPIHGKGCAWRRHVGQNVQRYLAFLRSTTPIHGKGCASRRKCATLPRVQAFDHANPWEGLRVAPTCWKKCATLPRVPAFDHANPWEGLRVMLKMCNFTSRSCVRPRQSIGKGCAENVQLYLAFKRSTTPIHGKG